MASTVSARPIDILLVEDNPGDSRLAHEALTQSQVQARLHVVRDGVEAMSFLRNGAPRPDLIFLDLNLPRKDGRSVLAEIKSDDALRRIPIVILTSSQAEEDIVGSYDLRANCFIRKPADWETFQRTFSEAVLFWGARASLPTLAGAPGDERIRVLLIEDDPDDALLVQELLSAAARIRFHVETADSLATALPRLEAERYDAVLLDACLPDATGAEAMERVLDRARGIPILSLVSPPESGAPPGDATPQPPDILGKAGLESATLIEAIRRAIERARWRHALGGAPHRETFTGLPNRSLLLDRLGQAIELARRQQLAVAVLCLDLDDHLGIDAGARIDPGDRAPRLAAQRLSGGLRASDTVARLGAGEFGMVLQGLERTDNLAQVAAKIQQWLEAPGNGNGDGAATRLSTCIGASIYPGDGSEPERLLRRAESALRRARLRGPGSFESFSPARRTRRLADGTLPDHLLLAIRRNEFVLYYQPILDATGRCAGAEALLRWRHPEWGLLRPMQFLEEAEDSGLILEIGEWVLQSACAQGSQWHAAGRRSLRVAVNVSPKQFGDPRHLVGAIDAALERSGLDPALLEVQIDEGALLNDAGAARLTVQAIRERGVQTSIGNFGSGYSPLTLLKDLPIDTVRIDRSYISGVPRQARDAALVDTIIGVAHGLRMNTVAEGIETIDQLNFLLEHQIDQIQGHFIGRPARPDLCLALFDSTAPPRA